MNLIQSFTHAYPATRIMHWDGNKHLTSRELVNMGMKCCTMCGHLMPLEVQVCGKCGEDCIVFSTDLIKDIEINILVGEVRPMTNLQFKKCKKCRVLKPITDYSLRGTNRKRVNCDECIDKMEVKCKI